MARHSDSGLQLPVKPKYKSQFATTKPQEQSHVQQASVPDAQPVQVPPPTEAQVTRDPALELPLGRFFGERPELDTLMTAYRQNPGICPLCNAKIGRGAAGHISKCLRILKSKTESTTIT